MSASDPANETSQPAPPAKPPDAPKARKPRPPRGGGAASGLALLLAVLALLAVAYGGWRLWQLEQGGHSDTRALRDVQSQVQAMRARLHKRDDQNQQLQKQLQDIEQHNQGLNARIESLSERSRSLENAVAGLSARARSGHDALRLDEAEMLLRMAGERFTLFHDSDSAMHAYAMADKVMAQVEDPSFAGVIQSIQRERKALAATHPGQRHSDLETLSQLRGRIASLPLQPLDTHAETAPQGFWRRAWHAVSGLIRVSRDNGEMTPAKRSLTRSLTALDLAQAQAALLAWDHGSYRQALQRADTQLQRFFDPQSKAVQQARADIAQLLSRSASAPPQLGAALHALQNLRSVQGAGAANAASTSKPAAAASSAGKPGAKP